MPKSKASEQSSIVFSRVIPAALRAEALAHNDFTCHMCGHGHGESDSTTGRKVRLRICYLIDKNQGGKDKLSNLNATCYICIQGSKSIVTERPPRIWLLTQVRRAYQHDQIAVLEWLRRKFGV